MKEGEAEPEDELIDLNKEPIERKRRRVDKEESNCLPQVSGRVLRSRTMAVSDGEKQAINMDIVVTKDEDEVKVPVTRKITKGKRGRPRKTEGKCPVSLSNSKKKDGKVASGGKEDAAKRKIFKMKDCNGSDELVQPQKKKGRIGRPPKQKCVSGVSSLNIEKKDDEVISDGEKIVINGEIDSVGDEVNSVVLVQLDNKKINGRKGSPPRGEGKCGVSSSIIEVKDEVMSDGEKIFINREIDLVGDEVNSEVPVPLDSKKTNGRKGRLPKVEGKCGVSSSIIEKKDDKVTCDGEKIVFNSEIDLIVDKDKAEVLTPLRVKKMKGRRGRPPKFENTDKVKGKNKIDKSNNQSSRGKKRKKCRLGRPPKMENVNSGIVIREKKVRGKINGDHKINRDEGGVKRLKDSGNDLGNGIMKRKNDKDLGPKKQKQLLRDKIVAMLFKAGWTVERRQRQSKDYADAVYVDREGRGYWSVTLAYKKFKEKIDQGKASEIEISVFDPIPEETFSMLFRITEKGKRAGYKKVSKKESYKGKSVDRKITSKLDGVKTRSLLVRKPKDGSDNGDGYILYDGKRTLLSWMNDLGTVQLGGKVKYKIGMSRRARLEGKIRKDGISCDCCNITHSIWEFESHAQGTLGKPYENIYLESGNSLSQCLVDSWKKYTEIGKIEFVHIDVDGDDPSDDTCNVCGDGGDLICCDSCPSTFHSSCLQIEVPSGDWQCVYCSCKYCGMAGGSMLDTEEDHNLLFSKLSICTLCEEKFHVNCSRKKAAEDFYYENSSFCGNECFQIFQKLQVLLGVRSELEEGFFYTVLQHHNVCSDASLSGDSSKVESNSKLAVAFSVMDECFEPIIDERSGTNMIHNVVYNCGSNIRRLNYGGFYTIALEKGDEFVSAASIRIHGSQLAEMPFIGTRYNHRRQGMCSRLLTAVETVLSSLNVKKLVLPAISETYETWTKVFGFSPFIDSKWQETKYMSMVVFPGIDMLQRPVSLKGQRNSAAIESTEVGEKHWTMPEIPASDSQTSFDVNFQNHIEAAKFKSSANPHEVETYNQNIQENLNEDIKDLTAPLIDVASVAEILNHDKVGVELGANMLDGSLSKDFVMNTEAPDKDFEMNIEAPDKDFDMNIEAPEVKPSASMHGVATQNQNTEELDEDIGGLAAPLVNLVASENFDRAVSGASAAVGSFIKDFDMITEAGEVEICANTHEVETHNQSFEEQKNGDIGGLMASGCELYNSNTVESTVSMPNGDLTKVSDTISCTVNLEESSDHVNHLIDIDTSNDNNTIAK